MNTIIKNEKTIDMDKINSRINLALNGTQESLEFINQILPFIKERMPLRINVQKKANGAADVLIETEIDSNNDYGHKIFIKDGFSIGYNGEGARGLLNLFKILGAENSELESLVLENNEQFRNKRLVVEIEE